MPRNHIPHFNARKHMPSENINGHTPAKRFALESKFQPQDVTVKFEVIGGYETQLMEATSLAFHLKNPKIHAQLGVLPLKGFLLHGPPGTGKSMFARALAGQLTLPLFYVPSTELVAGISGESEKRIRELFNEAVTSAPSIILLDDIDVIAAKRENVQREMERRIVSQLIASLDELEDGRVLVIGTTTRLEVLDASLRRAGRFEREISLGIPDERVRLKILEIVTKGVKSGKSVCLQRLAHLTPGYVGADLRALVLEASFCAVNRVLQTSSPSCATQKSQQIHEACQNLEKMLSWMEFPETLDESKLKNLCVEMEDFIKALRIVLPSVKREGFATVPDVTWDDIGALKEVRTALQWSILNPIQHPEYFEIFAAKPKAQGVLLCGPPGCGKTLLAKAVANETGMNFISVKGPELLNMYVGESERAVRTVFQRARDSSPCVIFFDEIDALCPKRSNNESTGSARLVNQLLTEMDGMESRKEVFLIGATNRPDMVDPAVLRPGRFDKIFFVDFPNAEDRADILRKTTKDGECPRISPSVNFAVIANNSKLNFFTGADLVALVDEASTVALKERLENTESKADALLPEHFEVAMQNVNPSVSEDDRRRYANLKNIFAKKQ